MDFERRRNPWAIWIGIAASILFVILAYVIWYLVMRRLTRFKQGRYHWDRESLELEFDEETKKLSAVKLKTWNPENQNIDWQLLSVKKNQKELTMGQMKMKARLAPIWKPHKVFVSN